MENPTPVEEPKEKFFWLFNVNIIYNVDGGLERQRPVNVLMKSFNPFVNETTIGNVNQSAQIQAMQHKKIPRKAKIIDVVIAGFGLLGHMTDEQFHKQGGVPFQEAPAPAGEPSEPAN